MMNEVFFCSITACIVSMISIIANIYVYCNVHPCCYCIINKCKRKTNNKVIQRRKKNIFTDLIGWMCITSGIHSLATLLIYLPKVYGHHPINQWIYDKYGIILLCYVATYIQSPIWHMLVAYYFYQLLSGNKVSSLERQKKYLCLFAIIVRVYIAIFMFTF